MSRKAAPLRLKLYGPDTQHGTEVVKKGSSNYVYYICGTLKDGRRIERATGFGLGEAAQATQKLADFVGELASGPHKGDGASYLVTDALTVYGTRHAIKVNGNDEEPPTATTFRYHLKALVPFFSNKAVAELNTEVFDAYARHRQKQGVEKRGKPTTDSTIRRELVTLQSALNFCRRDGLITTAVPVVRLPADSEPRDIALSRDECARLLWAALGFEIGDDLKLARMGRAWQRWPRHLRAPYLPTFIAIAIRTAARKEAILGLQFRKNRQGGHVDLATGIVDFRKDGVKQTRKRRAIQPIANKLRTLLRAARRGNRTYVFENDHGERINNLRGSFETAVRRARLPKAVVPHTLSHTAVTLMVMDDRSGGNDALKISLWTGKSLGVIQRVYLHANPSGLAKLQAQR